MNRSFVAVNLALLCLCLWLDQNHSQVVAETIECRYINGNFGYATEDLIYYCAVTNRNIFNTGERVHIDGVSGQHEAGKTNEQVQGIEIDEAPNMGKFPTGFATIFPNLIRIYVANSNLREITTEDLREFPHLKYLWLRNNQLTHIREELFEHNKHLEILGVNGNEIVHVDSRSLSELSKLRVLDFDPNPCKLGWKTTRSGVEDIVRRIEANECRSDDFTTTSTTQNPRVVKIRQLEAELENMTAMVNEQETQIRTLNVEKRVMQARFEDQTRQKDKKIQDLSTENLNKDKIIQNLTEEKAKLESSNQAYEANAKAVSQMAQQLTTQIIKRTTDFETLKAKFEALEEQTKLKEQEISECHQKLEDESVKFDKILQKFVSLTQVRQNKILAAIDGGCGAIGATTKSK